MPSASSRFGAAGDGSGAGADRERDRHATDGGTDRSSHRDPASGPARRPRRLVRPAGFRGGALVFALSFGFYLLLGDLTAFDLATGAVSAAVVTLLLSRVAFAEEPSAGRTLPRVARAVLFGPYLVWEILRANVGLAAVLVDPRLPIDPSIERIETGPVSDLERAVLANSVSLTPGTVAVDVREDALVVHTLTEASRADLYAGGIRRAVRFVFGGREAARAVGSEAARGDGGGETGGRAPGGPGTNGREADGRGAGRKDPAGERE